MKILESLPKRAEAKWISEEDIDEWAKYLLNGRQIRNIIHSALLLAELQGSSGLKPKQIEECIKHTNQLMEIIKREKKKVEMEYLPSQWS